MLLDRHTRDQPSERHLQVLTRSQLDLRRAIQKLLLLPLVVLLPAVIRKRRHVIKNESVILGVELRRRVRCPRAPSRAIAVNQLPKGGVIRGLLLRPGSNEGQQCTAYPHPYVHHPHPSLALLTTNL